MIAPTTPYGCGDESCVACYGDEEWRIATLPRWSVCENCGETIVDYGDDFEFEWWHFRGEGCEEPTPPPHPHYNPQEVPA